MVIDPDKERPRTADTNWIALGQVVYAWTDKRPASEDAAWWRKQAAFVYARTADSGGHVDWVDENMTPGRSDPDKDSHALCQWNLRVVEKEEA